MVFYLYMIHGGLYYGILYEISTTIFYILARISFIDFTWWPINSHHEDALKEDMEDIGRL